MTTYAALSSSDPGVAALVAGRVAGLGNRVKPTALGDVIIDARLGSATVASPVTVQGVTSIASMSTSFTASADGVDAADPSRPLCTRTLRGTVGTLGQLIGTFAYTESDGLNCTVTMPLGNLPAAGLLTDVLNVASQVTSMTSSGAAITVEEDTSSPGDTAYLLTLRGSAERAVAVTTTGSCTADGQPTLRGDVEVFANVEAEALQLDIGNRCGAPLGGRNGTTQGLLPAGGSVWVPVYFRADDTTRMQSITALWQFAAGSLTVSDVVKPGTAVETEPAYDCFTYSSKVALAYSAAVDRVKFNVVWPQEVLPACAPSPGAERYSVIAVMRIQVNARSPPLNTHPRQSAPACARRRALRRSPAMPG